MAEFMNEHQNLAKNVIPNCAQGKTTANRLWDELAKHLNSVGPPVKDVKMWKKAYADQKYQAKKKLSFNKCSKKRTGGGPYEEKILTVSEELLIEAAGLEAAVEGNTSVPTFGNPDIENGELLLQNSSDRNLECEVPTSNETFIETPFKDQTKGSKRDGDQKLLLLEKNIKAVTDFQSNIDAKLDRLLSIQERILQIKEEKHKSYMAVVEIELEIKRKQLQLLENNIEIQI